MKLDLENLGLVELNAVESAEVFGGSFWSWLGDHLGDVIDGIIKIIDALK